MAPSSHVELMPLGGLGEFGMNLMVVRQGRDCLVIDSGMMFPGAGHHGIDVIIPDLTFLESCGTLHGLILTHGHEDHIGAVPWLLSQFDVPTYATPYTSALVRRRLREHGVDSAHRLRTLDPAGGSFAAGPFEVRTIPVAHSIPQSLMLAIRTSAGTIVHTADFKLDPAPLDGVATDLGALRELGRAGVLALLSDSTNAEQRGFTPSERAVAGPIAELVRRARGRVLLTTFSSNVHRIGQVARIAKDLGRKLAVVGSSLQTHVELSTKLGLLDIPAGVRVSPEMVMDLPPREAMILVTGSQGEPMSALARIAVDRHRDVYVEDGDMVIHSARSIPGNEKNIGRMFSHLLRRGAEVVSGAHTGVHVSGHPSREELRWVLQLLRPRHFMPIHGDFRQLFAHVELVQACDFPAKRTLVASSGDLVVVGQRGISVEDHVHVGHVFIDSALDEVEFEVLRDRRKLAGDGIVVPVIALREAGGGKPRPAEIITRGFVPDGGENGIMGEATALLERVLRDSSEEERSDEEMLKARVQSELKRFLRRRTQRRPLIIPVVVEL